MHDGLKEYEAAHGWPSREEILAAFDDGPAVQGAASAHERTDEASSPGGEASDGSDS